MMGKLIVARHHESEWNKLGKWTGEVDVGLTNYGFEMSKKMGELINDLKVDQAFASDQIRSVETLFCMEESKCIDVPITRNSALNERDYGIYTGKNKMEMLKVMGEEEFDKLRRAWDYPVPEGETLKMVYERAVPYYLSTVLPLLKAEKNILLVAHGNSIRALMKYIEKLSEDDMMHVEMLFGAVVIYELDKEGYMVNKEVREISAEK
ncbi:MAG: histidine phosphatase family protein [Candidatus Parcubacteria bacterium]|nr:histidine phosphatase family protein [Candidatus Parcubacteria bacterium]